VLLVAVIDKRGHCAALFVSHGHRDGYGVDADGFKARRRIEQQFDRRSLMRLPGVVISGLCRHIELASQLDRLCVGVAER